MSAPLLVADSGPLIALARLDLLDLPIQYFQSALLAPTVWDEVIRGPKAEETARLHEALRSGSLWVAEDPVDVPDALVQTGLDTGERDSLALALSLSATVLVDERQGRRAAHTLGLPVLGTLGLLVRARQDGIVPSLRVQIDTLLATGYYLSPELVARVLAEVGE
jgi:predicted nucleic acid-binding protein